MSSYQRTLLRVNIVRISEEGRANLYLNKSEFKYVLNTGHTVDYTNFKILARAPTDYKLRIKESLIIKEHSPELNNNETSVQLNLY